MIGGAALGHCLILLPYASLVVALGVTDSKPLLRNIALHLAEKIAAGQPLPPEYAELRAERAEDLQ